MGVIRIQNVWKSYDGQQVLTGFTARLEEGRVYALMGPSGIGKTTLLRILAGLESADSGSVEGIRPQEVGMVFQEDRLLEYLTAAGNVRFACPGVPDDQIRRVLTRMGLADEEQAKPVCEYSGGMKRRAALARALLAEGSVLLLDEPFRGLDQETADQCAQVLLEQQRGRTVLMSTHSPREAAFCKAQVLRLS